MPTFFVIVSKVKTDCRKLFRPIQIRVTAGYGFIDEMLVPYASESVKFKHCIPDPNVPAMFIIT